MEVKLMYSTSASEKGHVCHLNVVRMRLCSILLAQVRRDFPRYILDSPVSQIRYIYTVLSLLILALLISSNLWAGYHSRYSD